MLCEFFPESSNPVAQVRITCLANRHQNTNMCVCVCVCVCATAANDCENVQSAHCHRGIRGRRVRVSEERDASERVETVAQLCDLGWYRVVC